MAPDNGSGTYTLAEPGPINGQTGDATPITANLEDIQDALTARLMANGTKVPTANQPMGNFKHTGVADATALTHYASAKQVTNGSLTYGGVAGGTADALTIAPSPGISAYAIGQQFQFKVGSSANTGAVTLNVNSVGSGAVTWPDGTALVAGDLPANGMVVVVVQATTPVFHLAGVTRAPLSMTGPAIAGRVTGTGAPASLTAIQTTNILLANASFGLKQISGWTYANNGSDATNDIDIAAGAGADSTGAYWIKTAALTKQLDAAWAVGTNQGGLDTGSIGNSDYYIWAIARSDTGVTDILFSLSATAPTMPGSGVYDYKRLIGWFKRSGAANVAFFTYEMSGGGLEFYWTTPRRDVNVANTLTTTRRTDALSVPLDFSTKAIIRAVATDATTGFNLVVCNPAETDAAPSATDTPGITGFAGAGGVTSGEMRVRTSAAGLVASRATLATVDNYIIITTGFEWSRR